MPSNRSGSHGASAPDHWPTTGGVHTGVRNMFVGMRWGTTTLRTIEAENPRLMQRSLSFSSVSELMRLEDSRSAKGPWVSRGDYAAAAALPVRTPALHLATALASHGHTGVRGLVKNSHGYGLETYASLTSGTF